MEDALYYMEIFCTFTLLILEPILIHGVRIEILLNLQNGCLVRPGEKNLLYYTKIVL